MSVVAVDVDVPVDGAAEYLLCCDFAEFADECDLVAGLVFVEPVVGGVVLSFVVLDLCYPVLGLGDLFWGELDADGFLVHP